MSKLNILLILTGGTICSFENSDGERGSDVERAQYLIVEKFKESGSDCAERVDFDIRRPIDTLSENISVSHWNTLISELKSVDFARYDGVIILHGTDTLAYTSSLLAVLLDGIKIPVFLVSSQLPIYMAGANGVDNFKAAVELTARGIAPNVYVVYKNLAERAGERGGLYLHMGSQLRQCAEGSNNFYSEGMTELDADTPRTRGVSCAEREMPLYTSPELLDRVLFITPYAAINYSHFSLRGVRAVLHGVYHSQTLSAAGSSRDRASVLSLLRRCGERKEPIPLFIAPCDENSYDYESTGEALRAGALALCGMTTEMAYIKLLIGCSAGLSGGELCSYVNGISCKNKEGAVALSAEQKPPER